MPKLSRNKKVTNFVKGSIKYHFLKRLSLADKRDLNTPTERTIPIFHPSPFSDGKRIFYLPFNRIPHKTSRPYLRSEHRHNEKLLILHEVGLLLITEE